MNSRNEIGYAELHCLSNFSFLRGASHPQELVQQAHQLGYRALAITDECSMAGVVRAYQAAQELNEESPFKLIIGAEFHATPNLHIVLLAPTQNAYSQICRLITLGRRRSSKGTYKLTRADFDTGLSECLALWIPPAQPTLSQAFWLRERFGERSWLAVELHRNAGDARRLVQLRELAGKTGLPLVAAGDVHMHTREHQLLQDTVTAIRHRCTLQQAGYRLFSNAERHLRSYHDLTEVYPRELLRETLCIAERCEFSLGSLRYEYPHELVPAGQTATEHLRELTEAGIRRRWPAGISVENRATVEKELQLIAEKEYEHFFLTVHDLVKFAKKEGILCQGRGSAANSVVCYALGVTAVDPDKAHLLFARFLSKERNEAPDIDMDFEHERREEVIQYVYKKYGRERAAIAATVISYRKRSALRDVGKALGLDLETVDRLAKAQAWWDSWEDFQKNLADQGLHFEAGLTQRLCALVAELDGFPRHLSQHVGGFVISEQPVSELVPMENAAMPERTIIQWDKNDLEYLGLLKVDVLALGMLTALRKTFTLLQEAGETPTSMDGIPQDDKDTYDMICAADTVGVFQIESRAQMSMLPRLRPRKYYDLVIEVAIVRPGPIQGGMVHPYLKRRHMPEEDIPYPSLELKEVLHRTLGVPIFQEQVMQIAVVAAGYTEGQADQLRREMAAWKHKGDLEKHRDRLLNGMLERGYKPEFAEQIFLQIKGFGEYGFPESHSASFALLTYVSSYLKRHQGAAFFAGLINSQPMGFYQPAQLLAVARRQNVPVLPVDVTISDVECTLEFNAEFKVGSSPDAAGNCTASEFEAALTPDRKVYEFAVEGAGTRSDSIARIDSKDDAAPPRPYGPSKYALRLGLCLVRGLGKEDAAAIVRERVQGSPFSSVDDLAHRTQLGKRCVEALAHAGALRSLTKHRHLAVWSALGVERLPNMLAGSSAKESQLDLPPPTEGEEILSDYRQLGFSTGRHPLALLRPRLRRQGITTRGDLDFLQDGTEVKVGGLVTHLQHPQTAGGVIFGSLEDETGINNIIVWPGVFQTYRLAALKSTFMVVTGTLQSREGVTNIVAEKIEDYSPWIGSLQRNSRDFR